MTTQSNHSEALMRLNEQMQEQERNGNQKFFEDLIAANFLFRRAGGSIIDKAAYISALEDVKTNPYERSDIEHVEYKIDGETAVTEVKVIVKRKAMAQAGEYKNIRVFRRENERWKLIIWVNTKLRDLSK